MFLTYFLLVSATFQFIEKSGCFGVPNEGPGHPPRTLTNTEEMLLIEVNNDLDPGCLVLTDLAPEVDHEMYKKTSHNHLTAC